MVNQASQAVESRDSKVSASGSEDHYLGLDGLRGVAALAVVWYHFSSRLDLPYLFAHGYLAVDFFFVLSGFVIARAYAFRLATRSLPITTFYTMRLIRLLPLVIAGTWLAAAIEWRRPNVIDQYQHLKDTISSCVLGSLLIPTLWRTTLEQVVFPLNGPMWSLFFEAVANIAFALLVVYRKNRVLPIVTLISSGVVIVWGVWRFGNIDFGSTVPNFWFGFARVAWSFTAGVFLFYGRTYAPQYRLLPIFTVLALIFAMPDLAAWNMLFDNIIVLIVTPFLVLCASSAVIVPKIRKIMTISGNLSFPIYAIHYPIVRGLSVIGMSFHLSILLRLAYVAIATVAIVVASAFIYKYYDVPVRLKLSKFLKYRSVAKRP